MAFSPRTSRALQLAFDSLYEQHFGRNDLDDVPAAPSPILDDTYFSWEESVSTMDDAEAPAEARDMLPYTSDEPRDELIYKHRVIDDSADERSEVGSPSALVDDEDLLRTVQDDLHGEEERRRASSPCLESALREGAYTPDVTTPLEYRSPSTEKGPTPSEAAVMSEPAKKAKRKRGDRYYVMEMYERIFERSEVIDEPAMKLRSKKNDYADTQSGHPHVTPSPMRLDSSVSLLQNEPTGSPYVTMTTRTRNSDQALPTSPRRATRKETTRVLRDGKRISSLPDEAPPRERRRHAKKGVDLGSGETIRELQKPNLLYPSPPRSLMEKNGVTIRDSENTSDGGKGDGEYKSSKKGKSKDVIAMTSTSTRGRKKRAPASPDESDAEPAAENAHLGLVGDTILTTISTPRRPRSIFLCVEIPARAPFSRRAPFPRRAFLPRRVTPACLFFFCRPDRLRRTRRIDNPAMCRIVLNDIWAYRMRDEIIGLTTKKGARGSEKSVAVKGRSIQGGKGDGRVGRTYEGPYLRRNLVKVRICGDGNGV